MVEVSDNLCMDFFYYVNNCRVIERSIDFGSKITGLTINSESLLLENYYMFQNIVERNKKVFIWCINYKTAQIVEKLLPENGNFTISLIDDFKNIDRSNINQKDFKKSKLVVPLPYLMWGVNFNSEIIASHELYKPTEQGAVFTTELERVSKDTINEAERIAYMISEEQLSEIQRLIIISNYIQMYTQFVGGRITESKEGSYIIPNGVLFDENSQRQVNTVLLKNYGVCFSISNAMVLLGNNPYLGLNIRETFYPGHAWNIIKLSNGECYHIDITRNISRSPNRIENAIKASCFYSRYLLFGSETANTLETNKIHPDLFFPYNISKKDFDRECLSSNIEYLNAIGLLNPDYPDELLTYNTLFEKRK